MLGNLLPPVHVQTSTFCVRTSESTQLCIGEAGQGAERWWWWDGNPFISVHQHFHKSTLTCAYRRTERRVSILISGRHLFHKHEAPSLPHSANCVKPCQSVCQSKGLCLRSIEERKGSSGAIVLGATYLLFSVTYPGQARDRRHACTRSPDMFSTA